MRPGRLTPDNGGKVLGRIARDSGASMRPGRLTPDNIYDVAAKTEYDIASMRPGRLTPDNAFWTFVSYIRSLGFNEAGAINPG